MLKGFTQEELKRHYITFKVMAKINDSTTVVGNSHIGGKEGECFVSFVIFGKKKVKIEFLLLYLVS